MRADGARRALSTVGRWLGHPRAAFAIPPLAVLFVVLARLRLLRDADDGLMKLVRAFGAQPLVDRVPLVSRLDGATLAIALAAVVVGLFFVGLASLRSGTGDPAHPTRADRRRWRFVLAVLGVSTLCGCWTAGVQLDSGFGRFATWASLRDVRTPMAMGWTVSWLLTFAMGACVTSDRAVDAALAAARLRSLLLANALLVAIASALTVAGYDASEATLRAEGCWFAAWDPVVPAMRRSTAAFYVLVLAAKYVPAKAVLEWRASRRRATRAPGEPRAPDERRMGRFAVDVVAILAPAFAELLTRLAA